MSRSLKKAPYVEEKLYARICAMNENGSKHVLKDVLKGELCRVSRNLLLDGVGVDLVACVDNIP